MEKEFVPYQESLELKELGFDESCFGRYILEGGGAKSMFVLEKCLKQDIGLCLAPLYQQTFRWFREKFGLLSWVVNMGNLNPEGYTWYTQSIKGIVLNEYCDPKFKNWCMSFKSYEEAELECLKELIKIVKNEQHKN